MNGETWKPETSLRWRLSNRHNPVLEQIWICVETGQTEWRLVPDEWPEQSSFCDKPEKVPA